MRVSDLGYNVPAGEFDPKPEAGNVYVNMNITFENHTAQERHANPFHFVLLDAVGVKHTSTFFSGTCQTWEAVNIAPGGSYGPKCIAFQATATKREGMVLVWTPSGFGGGYNLKLT